MTIVAAILTIIAVILMLGGAFFLTVSCLGVMRFPDFYSRMHAVGKSETLGAILMLVGLALYNGLAVSSLKILLILAFVVIANPAATHLISRAALRTGLDLWTSKEHKDSLQHGGSSSASQSKQEASQEDNTKRDTRGKTP